MSNQEEKKCVRCGGDGETWDVNEERVRLCETCHGSGMSTEAMPIEKTWIEKQIQKQTHDDNCDVYSVLGTCSCKQSEAKQEPEKHRKINGVCIICDDPRFPEGKVCIKDNIKTPEEIASESIRQTLDYIDTVAMPKNYPDKVDMQVRMLAYVFIKAISAERNANAEKIRELVELSNSHAKSYAEAQERYLIARQELDHIKGSCGLCHPEEHHQKIKKLEKQMEIYRLETHRWSKAYKELKEEIND